MSKPKIDRTSPAYKKELYVSTTVIVFLTLLGSTILGWRISDREDRIAAAHEEHKELMQNPEKLKESKLDENQARYRLPVVR